MPIQTKASSAIRGMLVHPWVMGLKRAVRGVWWTLKSRWVGNPPLPAGVTSMLFVCLGNICRSPFAEFIARRQAQESEHPGRFASAGIRINQAARPPQDACDAAAAFGLSLAGHRPQLLTRQLVEDYDVIVVMEEWQLRALRRAYPDAHGRIVLLSLFDPDAKDGYVRCNIPDPYAQPRSAFDHCYQRIDRSISHFLARLQSAAPDDVRPPRPIVPL